MVSAAILHEKARMHGEYIMLHCRRSAAHCLLCNIPHMPCYSSLVVQWLRFRALVAVVWLWLLVRECAFKRHSMNVLVKAFALTCEQCFDHLLWRCSRVFSCGTNGIRYCFLLPLASQSAWRWSPAEADSLKPLYPEGSRHKLKMPIWPSAATTT